MEKSPDAFRTISEVAEWLDVPTHVLRFWESRFAQVKPVKRAGGRRYYRPTDMQLIGGIKKLLHKDGMTIRGAQKLLREEGVKYVAALSQPLDSQSADVIAFEAKEREAAIAAPVDLIDEATLVPKTPAPPAAAAPDAAEAAQAETPASETDPLEAAEPEPAAPDTGPATEMASGPGAAPAAKPEAAEAEPDATEPAPVSDAPARIHFGSSRAAGADDTADPELPFLGSRGGVPELERELDPEIAAEAEAARAVTAEPDMTEPAAAEPASAEAQPAPGIPATPDVPEHDPEDTDPGYPAAPGVAARLGTVAPKELAAHKAALSQICDELAALRQRMG